MRTLLDREKLVFNPPELGCVFYLPGLPGGSSKIYDRSPYGNIGTITGATWKRLPSGLWCLSFDGQDDYVDMGTPNSLSLTDVLTVESWINKDSISANEYFVGNWNALGDRAQYAMGILSTGYIYFGQRGVGGAQFITGTTRQAIATQWHHVVVTRASSSGTITLYLDAIADATTGTSDPTHIATEEARGNTRVGMGGEYTGETWLGKVILPRIYNRVLSALEIQHNFNREKHLFGVW